MKLRLCWVPMIALCLALCSATADDQMPAAAGGPEAEKRFPPLKLPEGFEATLFACDPFIEYPSVISIGPRIGSLLVAIDYLDGLGMVIERPGEVRLIEDTNADGYADKSTVFADGFGSIQGLAWHDGTVFVMHSPHLTALRDTNDDGVADERRNLITGLGLAPEQDQIRLHNANGVVAGHDGWLYLALGDHGCDVQRPEGDRLVLAGGGILRCRPDGRDLHVFSTGLRNIYDVALDEELNVFVRDNENDGGNYKIRVCHSFFGADHGYPYRYYERPAEALAPLADLGLGSSAGGVAYLETQFPPEYRGNLLFCEWGRAVVRYPLARSAASFARPPESDLAAGGEADPYGFKPTDVVVDRDGSLFVSDWADGQRPRRGRGRIYRIRYAGETPANAPVKLPLDLAALDSESYFARCQAQAAWIAKGKAGREDIAAAIAAKRLGVRGRLHAVWILAQDEPNSAIENLLTLAKDDPDPRVQAQAIRAVADLADPLLAKHRLDAGPGGGALAARLAALARGRDPRVMLEAILALGRLRWSEAPSWLDQDVVRQDAALAHAAQWMLCQSGNWPAVLTHLDRPSSDPLRAIALRAIAGQFDARLVDGLLLRQAREKDADRRQEMADLLTRVHRKPAAWTYWGFRPPPRPANSVAWERTEAIEAALNQALAEFDPSMRGELLRCMTREKIPATTEVLGRWLANERDPPRTTAILAALGDRPATEVRSLLEGVIREPAHTLQNRLAATSAWATPLESGDERIAKLATQVEDGPVLAELLRLIGTRKGAGAAALLQAKLSSGDALVRIAAVDAAANLGLREAGSQIQDLLRDGDPRIRAAAATAAGRLKHARAGERLLELMRDDDARVRRASLTALGQLSDPRALDAAVSALADDETLVPALDVLGQLGSADHAPSIAAAAQRLPTAPVLEAAAKALSGLAAKTGVSPAAEGEARRALARLHAATGTLLAWQAWGPLDEQSAAALADQIAAGKEPESGRVVLAPAADAPVSLGTGEGTWLAICDIAVADQTPVTLLTSSTGLESIQLNGEPLFQRMQPAAAGTTPDRVEATLPPGATRIVLRLSGTKGPAEFSLRFRRKSASADHERLAAAALSRTGNLERGRKLLLNVEKSLCLKCHRLGDQGERVGPDLTGLASRFSKIHVVESILEPSRSINTSFQGVLLALVDGRRLTGIQVAQSEADVTLVDAEGRRHTIARTDIEAIRKATTSAMPDGLEKKFTENEFVDLIAYLTSLREGEAPAEPSRP